MASDLDIARSATLEPIEAIAWKLGISSHELVPMGKGMAKITWEALSQRFSKPQGSLVLVTSVNPTPFGEGKTVTTIGLTQALCAIGQSATCVIREPSMGPVFGIKGGAAGGGQSQVLPMEDINLHFTGDLHAVTSAHNLLSALIDNHIKQGNDSNLEPTRIFWPRVIDMNDRALRDVVIGLGGPANGNTRQERFDITAASEVMAILVLAQDYADLRRRIGEIVIGESSEGNPVKAEEIGAAGAMTLLLRNAFLPNMVQTLEGNPAFIHGGPFANIAHGNSSIIADRLALGAADIVVTEAGFGSDMGAEKFMHIKAVNSGKAPDCVVMNVTVRSMKLHGGAFGSRGGYRPTKDELEKENVDAVIHGAQGNLDRHIKNMAGFGMPVIVSINRFDSDTDAELDVLRTAAQKSGATEVTLTEVHANGGKGGEDLAKAVVTAVQDNVANGRPFTPLYTPEMPIIEKMNAIATRIYKADGIEISTSAMKQLSKFQAWGYDHLPVCMAKTQYSFSHDPGKLGAPVGFTVPVREFRLNAGAGFIVAILGNMMTMPGLPKRPAALDMDMDDEGNLTGVFG
ncbi:MAG: formate--tetrahydrofolate ligase [Euryarchaeota archaeon]|nr:formate--tetrahydrofolate ligase [Euryarchaeota archaeon]MBT5594902.1 formate--tetrahydrofolate ligase [Euryarchaeota archaeon]MBT5844554.1 formate--tetrahydrofolate ligase [Euryarchaeota archaeon]MBT6640885.1 formate--tetrahydrofolate ligase [Euryarchaeota archaeon]MBT6845194.1 formate--tetrahydrofolate ligase [Euryarchaeota archaeon]